MTPFLFRCPTTRKMVQAMDADEDQADRTDRPGEEYVGIECLSCGDMHLVNPRTGKVLGHADE